MATMMRTKARWAGFQGAPGYSIFHWRFFDSAGWVTADATAAIAKTKSLFDAVALYMPPVVSVQVESDVEIIEETNGELTDVLTGTSVAATSGAASGGIGFATAVGGVITWRSSQIRNGRRMRGRTFLVPLSSSAFESNGTLVAGAITNMTTGANAIRTAGTNFQLGIYGRPSGPLATDGIWGPVNGHSIPDMGAVLRSRRD